LNGLVLRIIYFYIEVVNEFVFEQVVCVWITIYNFKKRIKQIN